MGTCEQCAVYLAWCACRDALERYARRWAGERVLRFFAPEDLVQDTIVDACKRCEEAGTLRPSEARRWLFGALKIRLRRAHRESTRLAKMLGGGRYPQSGAKPRAGNRG